MDKKKHLDNGITKGNQNNFLDLSKAIYKPVAKTPTKRPAHYQTDISKPRPIDKPSTPFYLRKDIPLAKPISRVPPKPIYQPKLEPFQPPDPSPAPASKLPQKKKINKVKQSFNLNLFAYDLIFIIILGFISTATSLINWVFLAYGVFVVIRRIPSQRVFICALICLIAIPLLTIIRRDTLANNFAVFTFFFLAIGTIRAVIELRTD